MNKLLIALLVFAGGLSAGTFTDPSTCSPNFLQDGIAIPAGCPNLVYRIIAEPSVAFVSVNDNSAITQGIGPNLGAGDGDFNDGAVFIQIFDAGNGLDNVFMSWYGALSAWHNSIKLGSLTVNASTADGSFFAGAFPAGSLLDMIETAQDGNVYDSLNQHGFNSFWEAQGPPNGPPTESMPEPGSIGMVALGVGLIGLRGIGRKG